MMQAQSVGNTVRQRRLRELIATQDARYDYDQSNLHAAFPDTQVQKFEDWLAQAWSGV